MFRPSSPLLPSHFTMMSACSSVPAHSAFVLLFFLCIFLVAVRSLMWQLARGESFTVLAASVFDVSVFLFFSSPPNFSSHLLLLVPRTFGVRQDCAVVFQIVVELVFSTNQHILVFGVCSTISALPISAWTVWFVQSHRVRHVCLSIFS